MKVLLTGSRGRVGPVLLRFLRLPYAEVVPTDLKGEALSGDLRDPDFCREAVEGVNAVLHFAAIPHPGPGTFDNNVASTRTLLDAAVEADVERFVLASTINVFGTHTPDSLPIDETQPCQPVDNYAHSKVQCEAMLEAKANSGLLKGLALRLPAVWTDYRTDSQASVPLDFPLKPGRLVDPWHYLDVRDLASSLISYLSLEDPPSFAACYLLASETTTSLPTRELLERFAPDLLQLYRTAPAGHEALYSNRLATELLEWSPTYSWRSVPRGRRVQAMLERAFPRVLRTVRRSLKIP